jgi:mono/diheme cytochrome c family protein
MSNHPPRQASASNLGIPPLTKDCFLSGVVVWTGLLLWALLLQASAEVDYLKSVKPLLQKHCYACHGALKQAGGLRLDTAASLLRGGDSGPAALPGDPGGSLLLERVQSADSEEHMPPKQEGESLSGAQVALLRDWIGSAAAAPAGEKPEADPREHWAFRPRMRPVQPAAADPLWVRTSVDAFVSAQHKGIGLRPAPEAPGPVLLRRLFLDLVGVPPTPEEASLAQTAGDGDWYGKTVDRLLADPRHGERWGRHWMDIWRYSDWWGLGAQLRNSQKHMWHWRDWIIESLNADTPYDEMVRLMLAADEIAPEDPAKLRATGFLARNWFLFNRNTWMEETVEHVGKAFLGLTLNCAKCHDHKYDPVSQMDFYRMRAFFEPYHVRLDVTPGEVDLEKDGVPRVFDGVPAVPTYRFVRGEESNPDKSVLVQPGVPALLAFADLKVRPVVLPAAASQPERQPWVLEAHEKNSRTALQTAREVLQKAAEKLEEALTGMETDSPKAAVLAADLSAAGLAVAFREADSESIQRRGEAMRARWAAAPGEDQSREEAVLAERRAGLAKQRHVVAEAEVRLLKAASDKREAAQKELKSAQATCEKAAKLAATPVVEGDAYTVLYGAKWTPTRFLSSGKDDPEVRFPTESTGRRRALAEWLTDPRNPLLARVAANHLWTRHMGVSLVPNVFEFGRKGGVPSHPELLDWLASELVESGWSMKHLHRLIVNSAAYRMSSSQAGAGENLEKDPDNVHLWRRSPIRLESEVLRDSILALAGELDWTRGGPPVVAALQATSKRRSLYFYHSNNERNLFLTTFDQAAVKECYRREESIVPQQALALSNSSLVLEAAARIAVNISGGVGPAADAEFVRAAYMYVLGVEAREAEVAACLRALAAWRSSAGAPEAPGTQQAARSNLVWALLNHNDFVTLR